MNLKMLSEMDETLFILLGKVDAGIGIEKIQILFIN